MRGLVSSPSARLIVVSFPSPKLVRNCQLTQFQQRLYGMEILLAKSPLMPDSSQVKLHQPAAREPGWTAYNTSTTTSRAAHVRTISLLLALRRIHIRHRGLGIEARLGVLQPCPSLKADSFALLCEQRRTNRRIRNGTLNFLVERINLLDSRCLYSFQKSVFEDVCHVRLFPQASSTLRIFRGMVVAI